MEFSQKEIKEKENLVNKIKINETKIRKNLINLLKNLDFSKHIYMIQEYNNYRFNVSIKEDMRIPNEFRILLDAESYVKKEEFSKYKNQTIAFFKIENEEIKITNISTNLEYMVILIKALTTYNIEYINSLKIKAQEYNQFFMEINDNGTTESD